MEKKKEVIKKIIYYNHHNKELVLKDSETNKVEVYKMSYL